MSKSIRGSDSEFFEANWNHAATQVYACPRHKISILKLSSSPGVPH